MSIPCSVKRLAQCVAVVLRPKPSEYGEDEGASAQLETQVLERDVGDDWLGSVVVMSAVQCATHSV